MSTSSHPDSADPAVPQNRSTLNLVGEIDRAGADARVDRDATEQVVAR